jgi:hypothetical protein
MSTTQYNSERQRKNKKEISQLAKDSFEAIQPFINLFDCGLAGPNGPFHLITKEDWQLFARHKSGERKLTHKCGDIFNPYLDVVRNIYCEKHVHQHIFENQTTYFTSVTNGLGLLYLDIDAHHEWQKDEYEAKEILKELFPFGYFRASGRGQNGYLKVRYSSIEEFNALASSLESVLKQHFLSAGILCDIEVKGKITTKKLSGSLAKLPFNNTYPCYMRDDTDSWNYRQLELFKSCLIINTNRIKHISSQLTFDEQRVRDTETHKQALIEEEKAQQRASESTNLTVSQPAAVKPVAPQKTKQVIKSKTEKQGSSSGDAFVRNQEDLLPFVREHYKKHKMFPGVTDALDHLHKNGLFSGSWFDKENKRASRVGQILSFTEQTFDPSKLSSGKNRPIDLRLGKFAWWVRNHFGSGISVTYSDINRFDPYTLTAPIVHAFVPAHFIETFLTVADACMRQDPLSNQAVPTNRFKKLWDMVKDGSPWNQKYFQIVRERLNKLKVIRIIDRHREAGKAWKWEAGKDFPSESYKTPKQPSHLEAGIDIKENYKEHNTLYQNRSDFEEILDLEEIIRPPPWSKFLVS